MIPVILFLIRCFVPRGLKLLFHLIYALFMKFFIDLKPITFNYHAKSKIIMKDFKLINKKFVKKISL